MGELLRKVTPAQLAKAISAELSVELAEATLYADDGAAEIVKEFKSGTLALGFLLIMQRKGCRKMEYLLPQVKRSGVLKP